MKKIELFHLEQCPYCIHAKNAIAALIEEDPKYGEIEIQWIEESKTPELTAGHDYYYVPSIFFEGEKLYEAQPKQTYEEIKSFVKAAFEFVLLTENDAYNNLLTRRSCRQYKPDMVPQAMIDAVVKAGIYAPSSNNSQKAIVVAVSDKATRDMLEEENIRILDGKMTAPFYGAPVVLVVLAPKAHGAAVYDGSLVMGNMMNAAAAMGLGSCWIHRAKQTFEGEKGKALLASLGITEDYEGIGNCILGFPADELPKDLERKPDRVFYVK